MELERSMTISPAWDKTHPDPAKNYGVNPCQLRMSVKGAYGVVQFVMSTAWNLEHVQNAHDNHKPDAHFTHLGCHPTGYDVGYHALSPQYEDQESLTAECEYLDGRPCYYDGSSLRAEDWKWMLISKGSDHIWEMLEAEYRARFFFDERDEEAEASIERERESHESQNGS
jgi:hypothetical protein